MPVYDYECRSCGVFTALRPMAACDTPCECPECTAPSQRVFLRMPGLAMMDGATRAAHTTNEKSRHAPQRAADGHGANCGCCKAKNNMGAATGNGVKVFPSARPWMISH